jgi:hypothetical protein
MENLGPLAVAEVRRSRLRLLAPALQIAGAKPIVAAACALACVAMLALASFVPFVIATVVAVLAIGVRLASPRVWHAAAAGEACAKVELPSAREITDSSARALLDRISDARAELDGVLGDDRKRREGAEGLVGIRNVRDLERAAVASLRRIEYLSGAPATTRGGAGASANTRAAGEVAPMMERAAQAKAEREASLREIQARRLEELARLEYLTACLEAIPAQVMELCVLKADALQEGAPDPVHDADLLRDGVRHLRRELAGQGGA